MEAKDSSIAATWARIETWAGRKMPGLLAKLAPPADPAAVGQLERSLGFALPSDFAASLLVHDGEGGDGRLLDTLEALFSVEAIGEELPRERESLRRYGDFRADSIEGPVTRELYHPRRVVVADFNRDVQLLLDFAPAAGGTVGQVVRRDVEGGELAVVAPSWGAFLLDYADRLERGGIDLDPEIAEEMRKPVVPDVAHEDRKKRFFAAVKAQAKTLDLASLPDGVRVVLLGSVEPPWNSMGPDEYPFRLYSKALRLKGKPGIATEDLAASYAKGDHLMLRITAIHHLAGFLGSRAWLELESFEPFE